MAGLLSFLQETIVKEMRIKKAAYNFLIVFGFEILVVCANTKIHQKDAFKSSTLSVRYLSSAQVLKNHCFAMA